MFIYDAESLVVANREKNSVHGVYHTSDREGTVILTTSDLHPIEVGRALNGNLLIILVDEMSGSRMP